MSAKSRRPSRSRSSRVRTTWSTAADASGTSTATHSAGGRPVSAPATTIAAATTTVAATPEVRGEPHAAAAASATGTHTQ